MIQVFFSLGAFLLLLRCAQLQLFDPNYRTIENVTGVKEITIYPARGLIYDRDSNLLVYNDAMYDIKVTYNEIDEDIDTTRFCQLLGIDKATFAKNLDKDFKRDRRYQEWVPFTFLRKLSADNYARFQESMYEFPGFFAELRNVRGYNFNGGAHVLGYISEVNERQIEASGKYYREGDYIGTIGLEKEYEELLRGERGQQFVMMDNLGRVEGAYRGGAKDKQPVSGSNLVTTLDIELQMYGEKLMQNKIGSIVAIEPTTGDILALISSPGYDPNMLSINRNRSESFTNLAQDSLKPLLNRALTAQYPPGSTFKPILSVIGLQEEVLDANKGIVCRGAYYYNNRRFGCRDHAEPIRNMGKAIQYSCNTYYFQAFRDIIDKNGYENAEEGLDKLVDYLHRFGLGAPLDFDISGEVSGNVPTSDYYDKVYGERVWRSPFIISLGIGQGELLVTPVQMANMGAIIANRGHYFTPHIAKSFEGQDAEVLKKYQIKHESGIDSIHFEAILDGMEAVAGAGAGRIETIPYCGKTGTVQNPHGEDHSTFVAFAPRNNPQIAIAIFVENSGFGSTYAKPIASLMIEKYINGDIDRNNPTRVWIEKRMLETDLITGYQ